MTYRVNLTKNHENGGWSVYLPAISSFYVDILSRMDKNPDYFEEGRMPTTFENGHEGLNFLNEEKGYYHYKWGLYSVGHAERNLQKAPAREPMIHGRDRSKNVLVGDSGGFQVATGAIKLDWKNFKGPAGDKLRSEILNWLENTADYSMTFDVPAVTANPPFNKKTGLKCFEETVDYSVHNLHYFMQHRTPGKTKFLNVLSGSTVENARIWYDAVKDFSNPDKVEEMGYTRDKTLEGYAFAGVNMRTMYSTLERMLRLRDDGILQDKEWIHFLGIGRMDWACFLTSLQRVVRKHVNPNITFSFDAASPFVATAYGLSYTYNYFMPKKWSYNMEKAIDDKSLKCSKMQMPFGGPIMDRLTMSDICYLGPDRAEINGEMHLNVSEEEVNKLIEQGVDAKFIPAEKNKQGKVGRTSWDTLSYMFYMAHNVYNHIVAVQEANRIADAEIHRLKNVSYKDWRILKRNEPDNLSCYVPSNIIYFDDFVNVLFDPNTKDPYAMLEENKHLLDHISFGTFRAQTMSDLFETDVVDNMEEVFADMNNEKLSELEDKAKEDE